MRRFKQWLILKLGGFLHQEVVEYRRVEIESQELKAFAVRRDGLTRSEQSDVEHFERRIKEGLALDLANQLVEQGLIKFDSLKFATENFGIETHYTARLRVYKKKGVFDERQRQESH
jgi:hypothetical protein